MDFSNGYAKVYPFTTENILGYMQKLDIKNKDVLTVGSSLDQAFNSLVFGAKSVTVFDINKNTKLYYELKKAAIMSLNRNEFLNFLYNDFLNIKDYKKVLKTLRNNDIESYYFWDDKIVFDKEQTVKDKFFSKDVLSLKNVMLSNNYLLADKIYNFLGKRLKEDNIKILEGDILNINDSLNKNDKYDVMLYSNVMSSIQLLYNSSDTYKILKKCFIDGIEHLNYDGVLQYLYLYSIMDKDFLNHNDSDNAIIERIKNLWKILSNYRLDFAQFDSVTGKDKDSVITYTKKR